jgi:hypothetical protein
MVSSSRVHDLGRIMSDIFLKPSYYKIRRKGEEDLEKTLSPRDRNLEQREQTNFLTAK